MITYELRSNINIVKFSRNFKLLRNQIETTMLEVSKAIVLQSSTQIFAGNNRSANHATLTGDVCCIQKFSRHPYNMDA